MMTKDDDDDLLILMLMLSIAGASSFPRQSPCCRLPCIKAGLAVGMHTGMLRILCIRTAIHRMANAHLVDLTKGATAAVLLGTGRRPCGCILQVLL